MLRGCEDIPSYITKRGAQTLAEAWQTCDDGHELVRLCGAMIGTVGWPTKQEILLVVCDCAETVFPYLPKEELRARECVRVSRLWAEGTATVEEIKEVGRIADRALGIWSSPPDVRLTSGVPSWAANVAYCVAYAASHAADADAHAAAGRADAASSSSFAFMCITNAVPSLAASVLADVACAQGSPVWKDAQSESLKKMADLVRAKLQPTAWEI